MKCERTHERYRPDGSVERWTTLEDMPDPDRERELREEESHDDADL